jgi:hypothetical protein
VRRAARRIPGLVTALLVLAAGAWAQTLPSGRVVGSIVGAKPPASVKGAKVVLVRFTLDAQGKPQGSPIQTQEADANGAFAFSDVPIDAHSLYQLGTQLGGNLIPSESFTFPAGQRTVRLNLRVPEVSADASSLRIAEALVALEPQVGGVWVTEVVHLENPTPNVIEGEKSPLEMTLPSGAGTFEMLRVDQPGGTHVREGDKLRVSGNLRPGRTTVAFRYRLAARLGSLSLEKSYPYAVQQMVVLVPAGSLRISSDRLDPRPPHQIEGQTYDAWSGPNIAARHPVALRATNIPIRQELLLIPSGVLLTVLGGIVFWYLRRRLGVAA